MLPSNWLLINNPETFSHGLPKNYLNLLLNSRQIISNIYEIVKLYTIHFLCAQNLRFFAHKKVNPEEGFQGRVSNSCTVRKGTFPKERLT